MLDDLVKSFQPDSHTQADLNLQTEMTVDGKGALPSCFKTTELAVNSVMLASRSLVEFAHQFGIKYPKIRVDKRLASLWFHQSLYPQDWQLPSTWDEIAGDYPTLDGWIRLHTNALSHKKAALSVLDCDTNPNAVKQAVQRLNAGELETAIIQAGGCAAEMRSLNEWRRHPQGMAVMNEPLVNWTDHNITGTLTLMNSPDKPLNGLKVLDLTRVLAGPVSTRFLAGFGAEVVRIDPIDLWDDSSNAPEMSLGKRCAGLDLTSKGGKEILKRLISQADVFIHGYRPGALKKLGFDDRQCHDINPNLTIVSLCAYGWSGPWSDRRGFDSLVQMSSGIAEAGMKWKGSEKPFPLPVQALDHATGYLMAAAALHALAEKRRSGRIFSARLSLAATAAFLSRHPATSTEKQFDPVSQPDFSSGKENTAWGPARRLKFPASIEECEISWPIPAGELRSSEASFRLE